ncbi:MAG: hypothetical protein IT376_06245 [Polyangiaceae bacterium]|nr:hypothetical protein [Polyangiaceae bacterium]
MARWRVSSCLYRNTPTIANGSDRHAAFQNAAASWQNAGSFVALTECGTTSDMETSIGDTQSEAMVVYRSSIGGNNGRTLWLSDGWNLCWPGLRRYIIEADILVAGDGWPAGSTVFGNPDESQWTSDSNAAYPANAYNSFVHEWGHGIGLDHGGSTVFATMSTYQPRPYVGGSGGHVTAMGRDRYYVANAYGGPASHKDIAASAQHDSNGAIVRNMYSGTYELCNGAQTFFRWTAANLGTQNLTFNTRVSLNTWSGGYTGGITWFTKTGQYVGNRSHASWLEIHTIPWMAYDTTYFSFHYVDHDSAHGETNENNNFVHAPITYRRANGC